MVYAGDPRELANFLKYHICEEFLVSGGVTSHTRIKPMSGERLELGMVRTQHLCLKLLKGTRKCIFASCYVTWCDCINTCFRDSQLIHTTGQGIFLEYIFFFYLEELHYVHKQDAGCRH